VVKILAFLMPTFKDQFRFVDDIFRPYGRTVVSIRGKWCKWQISFARVDLFQLRHIFSLQWATVARSGASTNDGDC